MSLVLWNCIGVSVLNITSFRYWFSNPAPSIIPTIYMFKTTTDDFITRVFLCLKPITSLESKTDKTTFILGFLASFSQLISAMTYLQPRQ